MRVIRWVQMCGLISPIIIVMGVMGCFGYLLSLILRKGCLSVIIIKGCFVYLLILEQFVAATIRSQT